MKTLKEINQERDYLERKQHERIRSLESARIRSSLAEKEHRKIEEEKREKQENLRTLEL